MMYHQEKRLGNSVVETVGKGIRSKVWINNSARTLLHQIVRSDIMFDMTDITASLLWCLWRIDR